MSSEFVNTVDQYADQELLDLFLSGELTEFCDNVITTVACNAFAGQTNISKLDLPNVEYVSTYAFAGMANLAELNLPSVIVWDANWFYRPQGSCPGASTYQALVQYSPRLKALDLRSVQRENDNFSGYDGIGLPITLRELLLPRYQDVTSTWVAQGMPAGTNELPSYRMIYRVNGSTTHPVYLETMNDGYTASQYLSPRHLAYVVFDTCGCTMGGNGMKPTLSISDMAKAGRHLSNYGCVLVSNEAYEYLNTATTWCDIPNLFAVPQEQLALFDKGDYAYSLEGYTSLLPRMLYRCREFYETGTLSEMWGTYTGNELRSDLAIRTDTVSQYFYYSSVGVIYVWEGSNLTFTIGDTYLVNCFGKEYGVVATEAGLVCYDEYEGVRYPVIEITQADEAGNNQVVFCEVIVEDGTDLSLYTICDHVLAVYKKEE